MKSAIVCTTLALALSPLACGGATPPTAAGDEAGGDIAEDKMDAQAEALDENAEVMEEAADASEEAGDEMEEMGEDQAEAAEEIQP